MVVRRWPGRYGRGRHAPPTRRRPSGATSTARRAAGRRWWGVPATPSTVGARPWCGGPTVTWARRSSGLCVSGGGHGGARVHRCRRCLRRRRSGRRRRVAESALLWRGCGRFPLPRCGTSPCDLGLCTRCAAEGVVDCTSEALPRGTETRTSGIDVQSLSLSLCADSS